MCRYYRDSYCLTDFSLLDIPILFNAFAVAEGIPTFGSCCNNCIRANAASSDSTTPNALAALPQIQDFPQFSITIETILSHYVPQITMDLMLSFG